MERIILASASPRRKEILTLAGIRFEVLPSEADEQIEEKRPDEMVKQLSRRKADEIAQRTTGECLILGADTVVVQNGKILGKPRDTKDACRMLQELSGQIHEVFTGVTLCLRKQDNSVEYKSFAVGTRVKVTTLSEEQIEAYVKTGEPMDKAGAYAIQGRFCPYIEEIQGDYYNIVGLPIAAVCKAAEELGVCLR